MSMPVAAKSDETIVSATKREQELRDAPATVMVITAQQIRERGYLELDDVLRDLPGIDILRTHGAYPSIRTLRGSYGDENRRLLLMIDGIVENSIIGGFEMGGPAYSLLNVERVEVILGPTSALYGANAYSGIINIITKHDAKYKEFAYEKAYGTFNTRFDRFALNSSYKRVDLSLSGILYNTDGPVFRQRHPRYSNSYMENVHSIVGRMTYRGNSSTTTLGFHLFDTNMGDGIFGNTPTKVLGLPDMPNQNKGTGGYYQADIGGERPSSWHPYTRTVFLQHRQQVSTKLAITGKAQFRETGINDCYSYLLVSGDTFARNIFEHYSNRLGAEVQLDYSISERQSLIFGTEYIHDNLERGYRRVVRDNNVYRVDNLKVSNLMAYFLPREFTLQDNIGVFGQYMLNTNFLNETAFTVGARYNRNSIYGETFNPRIGIVNHITSKITVKLLFGTAYRAPTNFELYSRSLVRDPNPNLRPEKNRTYEIDVDFRPNTNLSIMLNTFRNQLTDLIIADVPIRPGVGQNQNVGKADIYGAEILVNYNLGKRLKFYANFSYQEAVRNEGKGNIPMPNIARFKGNLGTTVNFPAMMSISLNCNWVGTRSVPASNPLGKAPGYFVANLTVSSKRFFKERVGVDLIIKNLFNAVYFDPGIRSGDGNRFATLHEQPGINGLLKLGLYF
jgi:iron complex outermembrane receptor protein